MEPVLIFVIELALSDDGTTKDIEAALDALQRLTKKLEDKHAELSSYED